MCSDVRSSDPLNAPQMTDVDPNKCGEAMSCPENHHPLRQGGGQLSVWILKITEGKVTSIYGSAGSGKTNLCLWILSSVPAPSLYISTEGSLPTSLLDRYSLTTKDFYFVEALSLEDLATQIIGMFLNGELSKYRNICVDSVNAHYRYEVMERRDASKLFNAALAILSYVASRYGTRVLLTAQVREEEGEIVPSGYEILEFWSDLVLEVKRSEVYRVISVIKPIDLKERKLVFSIDEQGVIFE